LKICQNVFEVAFEAKEKNEKKNNLKSCKNYFWEDLIKFLIFT